MFLNKSVKTRVELVMGLSHQVRFFTKIVELYKKVVLRQGTRCYHPHLPQACQFRVTDTPAQA